VSAGGKGDHVSGFLGGGEKKETKVGDRRPAVKKKKKDGAFAGRKGEKKDYRE